MDIMFKCATNKNFVAINTLSLILPNGTKLTIDREETEYDIEGSRLDMTWRNCYIWAIDGYNIFGDEGSPIGGTEFKSLLHAVSSYYFELEEDAGEDYIVTRENITV